MKLGGLVIMPKKAKKLDEEIKFDRIEVKGGFEDDTAEVDLEREILEEEEDKVLLDEEVIDDIVLKYTVPLEDESVVSNYIDMFKSFPKLTKEEEYELAVRAKNGDMEAFRKLVEANLRFVVYTANKYKGCGLPLADLINEGTVGLIQAAKRFDPERGVRFISYAVWWIRQAIVQALAEQAGVVKLPLKQAPILLRIRQTYSELFQKFGREPTTEEIAEELGMEPSDVEDILRVVSMHLSLELPINKDDNDDRTYMDLLESSTPSAEDEAIMASMVSVVHELISQLPEREAKIIKLRFGIDCDRPYTLEEIGKMMGISRERVRQIESRALTKLRRLAQAKKLEDYLN